MHLAGLDLSVLCTYDLILEIVSTNLAVLRTFILLQCQTH